MDNIRTVLPFYSASGWIYCGDVWLLFQNSLQLMSCGVCICRHLAVTSDLVTLLFSRCALAINVTSGPAVYSFSAVSRLLFETRP
jgi:hypothetical protein